MARVGTHDIDAVSVGGIETCIELPGWDLAFDIGRCPLTAIRRSRLLLTHTHMDHASGLAYHAAQRDLFRMPPPTYYVPEPNLVDLGVMLDAWRRLDRSELPCTLVPVAIGERFELGPGRAGRAFRSPHRVWCQGYALSSVHQKLKASLAGQGAEVIRACRERGEPVTEAVEVIDVAFTGDATIEILDVSPVVRTARLLIIEVTFFDDDVPPPVAKKKGHVHIQDLADRAADLENEHVLLTHASARYSPARIRARVDAVLPEALRARVQLLSDLSPPLLPSRKRGRG